jgi:hypothetical protein
MKQEILDQAIELQNQIKAQEKILSSVLSGKLKSKAIWSWYGVNPDTVYLDSAFSEFSEGIKNRVESKIDSLKKQLDEL